MDRIKTIICERIPVYYSFGKDRYLLAIDRDNELYHADCYTGEIKLIPIECGIDSHKQFTGIDKERVVMTTDKGDVVVINIITNEVTNLETTEYYNNALVASNDDCILVVDNCNAILYNYECKLFEKISHGHKNVTSYGTMVALHNNIPVIAKYNYDYDIEITQLTFTIANIYNNAMDGSIPFIKEITHLLETNLYTLVSNFMSNNTVVYLMRNSTVSKFAIYIIDITTGVLTTIIGHGPKSMSVDFISKGTIDERIVIFDLDNDICYCYERTDSGEFVRSNNFKDVEVVKTYSRNYGHSIDVFRDMYEPILI